jgi:transposase
MMNEALLKATREERGLALARTARIKKEGDLWIVPSQSLNAGSYVVRTMADGTPCCTCPDFETRQLPCKHILAVQYVRHEIVPPDGPSQVPEMKRPTYGQKWPQYRAARMNEKIVFERLLRSLCDGIEQPPYKGNGRPSLPLCDVLFAAGMKIFSTFSSERSNSDVVIAQQRGLTGVVPHPYTTLRILRKPETLPIIKNLIEESAKPLREVEVDFALDGTGISQSTYVRWFDKKWGKDRREKKWLKLHAMCGVTTLIITGVEVTGVKNDSPFLPSLVDQTAKNFDMREVSADKGYLAIKNFRAIEKHTNRDGEPTKVFIPFKVNSRQRRDEVWNRLHAYYLLNREEFLAHYHKRSNSEALFSSMKRVLSSSVRARSSAGSIAEVYLKVLVHNIRMLVHSIYELGIDPEFWQEPKAKEVAS